MHEVNRHCGTTKHAERLRAIESQPSISSAMASSSKEESLEEQVMKAELYLALKI